MVGESSVKQVRIRIQHITCLRVVIGQHCLQLVTDRLEFFRVDRDGRLDLFLRQLLFQLGDKIFKRHFQLVEPGIDLLARTALPDRGFELFRQLLQAGGADGAGNAFERMGEPLRSVR